MRAAVPDRLSRLDARRRWARARAPLWFGVGVGIVAFALAGTGVAVVGMIGRAISLVVDRPLRELPVWGWAGWVVAGFAVLGLAIAVLSVAASVVRHGADLILRDVGAVRLDDAAGTAAVPLDDVSQTRLRNVVDALSLGLGVRSPRLAVVDDVAPNSLSMATWRDETLVVTSGLVALGRDELEAVAAHELASLHAPDARWVTAAAASLGRARGVAHVLEGVSALLVVLFFIGLDAEVFLITPLLGGLVIGGLALFADLRMGSAQDHMRSESDEMADVAAVLLARNPSALASACAYMSERPRRVRQTSWRADHLWFAPLPTAKKKPGNDDDSDRWFRRKRQVALGPAPEADPESAEEVGKHLRQRSADAYHAAGVAPPMVIDTVE
jgi:Zn-dependent protease with chaperone function